MKSTTRIKDLAAEEQQGNLSKENKELLQSLKEATGKLDEFAFSFREV